MRSLTRFSGYRCGQEAEQLPPPPACLSVDQLVQLATDAGLPQLTVVRDARKVPRRSTERCTTPIARCDSPSSTTTAAASIAQASTR
jgi:hypothetical protein